MARDGHLGLDRGVDLMSRFFSVEAPSAQPNKFGFNIGCLEGVDPCDPGSVPMADGGQWDEPAGPV